MNTLNILLFFLFIVTNSFGQKEVIERYEPYSLQTICDNFLDNSIIDSGDHGICSYADDQTENCMNIVIELYDDQSFKLYINTFDLRDGKESNPSLKSTIGTFQKKGKELILIEKNKKRKILRFNDSQLGLQYNMGNKNGCDFTYHLVKV